jgi:hypothetical protein
MATQISCGATDCGNNSGGGEFEPTCGLEAIRVAMGRMGAAICFDYTNAPVKNLAQQDQQPQALSSGIGAIQR